MGQSHFESELCLHTIWMSHEVTGKEGGQRAPSPKPEGCQRMYSLKGFPAWAVTEASLIAMMGHCEDPSGQSLDKAWEGPECLKDEDLRGGRHEKQGNDLVEL